jgi:hypothetical protein
MFRQSPHIPRREPVIVATCVYNITDVQLFRWNPAKISWILIILISSHHVIVLKTTGKELKHLFSNVMRLPHWTHTNNPSYYLLLQMFHLQQNG